MTNPKPDDLIAAEARAAFELRNVNYYSDIGRMVQERSLYVEGYAAALDRARTPPAPGSVELEPGAHELAARVREAIGDWEARVREIAIDTVCDGATIRTLVKSVRELEDRVHYHGLAFSRERTSGLDKAVAALESASAPQKPKTIEERLETMAKGALGVPDCRWVYKFEALRIARDYALEKMRECADLCPVREAGRANDWIAGMIDFRTAIAKLIEEEGRNG